MIIAQGLSGRLCNYTKINVRVLAINEEVNIKKSKLLTQDNFGLQLSTMITVDFAEFRLFKKNQTDLILKKRRPTSQTFQITILSSVVPEASLLTDVVIPKTQ